jgi:hypothetical protein
MSMILLAADLLVLPPDLMAPAFLSNIFRNDMAPEVFPPLDNGSPYDLRLLTLKPLPLPLRNNFVSMVSIYVIDLSPNRQSSMLCM